MKKRNRIVINLDQLPPGKRGARRGCAKPLIITAVVLLLLVGGLAGGVYLWWRNYQNSPAYTLASLADAAQRNDSATVDSIFDIDKVCDDLMAQVRQNTGGSAATAINSVLPAQTNAVLQTLTPKLKETMHDEVVKELQRLTEAAKGKPFILVALAITRFVDVKEENNVAQVKVNIKDEHLQLTMQASTQPGGPRWRVTAVQDDKLASVITESVKRNLPSSSTQVQDAVGKEWDKLKKHGK
jgi:uncharacterized membrane protein